MLEYAIYLQNGMGLADTGLAVNRIALGTFFTISGWHKLFNRERHKTVAETMRSLHIPFPNFNCWFVPAVEFAGGVALLTGILSPLAALGLFIICFVAVCTDGIRRIPSYRPIDKADWLDDLLYLPEMLYIFGLLIVMVAGPGAFTFI